MTRCFRWWQWRLKLNRGVKHMTREEYYFYLEKIEQASGNKYQLEDIKRELLYRYDESDPTTKELVKKLTR